MARLEIRGFEDDPLIKLLVAAIEDCRHDLEKPGGIVYPRNFGLSDHIGTRHLPDRVRKHLFPILSFVLRPETGRVRVSFPSPSTSADRIHRGSRLRFRRSRRRTSRFLRKRTKPQAGLAMSSDSCSQQYSRWAGELPDSKKHHLLLRRQILRRSLTIRIPKERHWPGGWSRFPIRSGPEGSNSTTRTRFRIR